MWRIEQVKPADQAEALELLEYCRPGSATAFAAMLQEPGRCRLYWARTFGGGRTAALAAKNPGRVCMLFCCPVELDQAPPRILLRLVRQLSEDSLRDDVAFVQAILSPHQVEDAELLAQAGFRRLAELIYMSRRLDGPLPAGNSQLDWHSFDGDEQALSAVISDTYVDSQDCPGLLGLRSMADVLASHKASGLFRPQSWWLPRLNGEPVGCVLINDLPAPAGASEVVYLGIRPAFRRRGLARQMLRHALRHAAENGRNRMYLAVDAANLPAVRLYESEGFFAEDRRVVYIRTAEPGTRNQ